MQWTDAPNQPPCWANNQTFLSIAPFSSRICWDLDYFHTMVLRQILTRYDLTSRITSCVREIRESAGNAFREPFSKISLASTGWFPGVESVCNPLPLASPTLMKLSAKQLFRMIAVSFLQPSHPSQIVNWTENG